ncbi:acyl carrier protein [Catenovulum sp. SX2]|uniref:acyl carrier protein n=1 Tax=Catenovulum sp. SX2 TaxID=3398614 RepID=UPI003F84A895
MTEINTNKLAEAFVSALAIDAAEVNDELAYSQHPKWDSTAHMVLVAEIEAAFDIMLDTDDIIDMSSFAKAKEIVAKY